MPTRPTTNVIERLRTAVLLRDGAGLGDGELLGCFLERRDEAALAALVRRHGPMVWGVCRRLLSHHDAEDAFQATFLVLVRKAASIMPRAMVGNWLYGVAHQTALQARRTAARRRAREVQVTLMPDTEAVQQDHWPDVQPLLDQELSRLPDNYRVVIVLCDLEDRTRKEVARQLGVPEGTVAGRLARARMMLAKRLARRGVTLSGGALAAVLAQNVASAGLPASVASSTIKTASLLAAGQNAAAGVISPKVAALTEGVLKVMLMSKLKAVVAVVLVLGFIVTGATVLCCRTAAAQGEQPPAAEEQVKTPQKQEKEKEAFTAWGKAVGGLQAGLGFRPGAKRAYSYGETVTLVLRVRNVSKHEVKFSYLQPFIEHAPIATDGDGKSVPQPDKLYEIGARLPAQVELVPGKEIELHELKRELKPAIESGSKRPRPEGRPHALYGTGTISVHYQQVLGDPSMGYPGWALDPTLSKLATGKLELEIKSDPPAEKRKAEERPWGDVVEGVQARLSPKKVQWKANDAPAFEFDLRNKGQKTFYGVVAEAYCELQVDGKWYKYRGNFPGAPLLPLKPGVNAKRWLAVSLGSQWLEETDAKKQPDKEGESIRLPPGKHTIRVAYRMLSGVRAIQLDKDVPDKEMPDLRVVTNAIEIEITKPAEKNGQAIESSKGSGKEKIKSATEDKKSADQPVNRAEERLWIEVGVKAEMVPASAVWKAKKDLGGGLMVLAVRPASPAAKAKIQQGDILVGLHIWETLSIDSCLFILEQCREDEVTSLKYSLVRNGRLQSVFMPLPPTVTPHSKEKPSEDPLKPGATDAPSRGTNAQAQGARAMPIRMLVTLEKVTIPRRNGEARLITASQTTLGAENPFFKPLRFEKLSVLENAKITDNGKEISFSDLKPLTVVHIELEARPGTFVVVGIEKVGTVK